jgi:hypothetical protein
MKFHFFLKFIRREKIMAKKATIISLDGEIIGELNEGDRIIKKEVSEYLEKTDMWKIENFYMGNIDELQKWMDDLTTVEKAFLFSIVPYISYEDCCIKFNNNTDIGTEDLVKISGLSRGKTYEVISSLNKKDIIYKGENSKSRQYFINPWLFCKGQRLNKVLKTMFKNYKIRILGNKKWSDIKKDN